MPRTRVLFLCTHNSARSQMAEGFLRALAADRYEADSAGTEKTSVNPLAIRAMAERGIDISGHTSKRYDDLLPARWDYLITVCDDANERCPFVPGAADAAALVVRGSLTRDGGRRGPAGRLPSGARPDRGADHAVARRPEGDAPTT